VSSGPRVRARRPFAGPGRVGRTAGLKFCAAPDREQPTTACASRAVGKRTLPELSHSGSLPATRGGIYFLDSEICEESSRALKSSKAAAASALVHTPTVPGAPKVVSLTVMS